MAIDSEAKRRSITNIVTRMGLGLLNGSAIDVNERPNTSFIYGFINYAGILTVPTNNLMVLYPIQPTARGNIKVFQRDSRQWSSVQKSANVWRHEITSLRFRIMGKSFMTTFLNFHENNVSNVVNINFPGVQPFIRTGSAHAVRILTFTAPEQISPLNYEITVTYRNTLRSATT